MAIKFHYNKTSLQDLNKQLKVRLNALPTLKNKESALRIEVKKAKNEAERLNKALENKKKENAGLLRLWSEFNPELIAVKDVKLGVKKIAGVKTPVLENVEFEVDIKQHSYLVPVASDIIDSLRQIARTKGISTETFVNLLLQQTIMSKAVSDTM